MVITCSDTRTPETDTSGQLIQQLLKDKGHHIAAYHLVKDEPAEIKARIAEKETAIKDGSFVVEINDAEPKSN